VNIAQLLPMAFVMIAGPQILSAIYLATSEGWRGNSAALLTGAALSITGVVTIAYAVGGGVSEAGGSHTTLDVVVLVLLIAAGVNVFLTRKTSEPPKWMGRLQNATPKISFALGFLLLGVFPTDILTSWAVGTLPRQPWRPVVALPALRPAHPPVARPTGEPGPGARRTGPCPPAEGTRLDEREFVDCQRARDRPLHWDHREQPRGLMERALP
jgi:Sap, sulfolipid-1-addressing protein